MTKKRKFTTFEKLRINTTTIGVLAGGIVGMMIIGSVLRGMEAHNFEVQQYWQSVEAPQPMG